ncbi:MAG TPA: copper oxidase [Polyangia bacterium]|jgi:FtsP/CotA-like multicopper oxidase with cupredoxin domain|nr:copper oxidase [Polyangia bacterium]
MSHERKSITAATDGETCVLSRRALLLAGATGGALAAASPARGAAATIAASPERAPSPGRAVRDYLPVTVPNGAKLPWKLVGGVKVFHLVAGEVDHEMAPGLKALCWGYNGRVHGPLIEAVEGDRVRIYVTNRLPAATTVHWHAILTPNGMDGVGGLTQKAIQPGETFKYEFTLRQWGTAMYHSHHDEMTQIGLGMTGLFVIHPRRPQRPVDRDFAIMLHEWRIDPGARRPNPNEMVEFNVLTMNARAFPGTAPLVVRTGQRVRVRIGNLSPMDHHPIHLHGHQFRVTETDGGPVAESAQWPETTVLVPTGSTRTIEFVAHEPGDWAMHCHMTHHVMNQMGHGTPNLIGVQPGNLDQQMEAVVPGYMTMGQTGMADMADMGMAVPANSIPMLGGKGKHDVITMGGMFTVLKVRDGIRGYGDPGWYDGPAGDTARAAVADDLRRDGIDAERPAPVEDQSPTG